ncbi:MAG: hypothetical protein AB7S26_35680 [Sandaracinaceae bacterium]
MGGWLAVIALCAGCDAPTPERYDGGTAQDAGSGYLGDGCDRDGDCDAGLVCRAGYCNAPGLPGDSCDGTSLSQCARNLECVEGACTSVGAAGEPCRSGNACDGALTCSDGVCMPAVRARFCHCLVSGAFRDPIFLRMEVDGVDLGVAETGHCTPCREVSSGPAVPVAIYYEDGRELGNVELEIMPSIAEQVLFGRTSSVEAFDVACAGPVGISCIP